MHSTPIHSGEILADQLTELGVTPSSLARQLRFPHNRIIQIFRGSRSITTDTALWLGHWFGTSAAFLLTLQSQYDVRHAEAAIGPDLAGLPRRAGYIDKLEL